MCVTDQGTVNVAVMYTTCGRIAIGTSGPSCYEFTQWLSTLMYLRVKFSNRENIQRLCYNIKLRINWFSVFRMVTFGIAMKFLLHKVHH